MTREDDGAVGETRENGEISASDVSCSGKEARHPSFSLRALIGKATRALDLAARACRRYQDDHEFTGRSALR